MFAQLQNLNVGPKIFGIVGLCLVALAGVAGLSIYQMNLIGGEIEEIAEQDVPLTEAVTNITVHQLDQAINLERAFRYGEEMQQSEHAAEQFALSVKKFHELAEKVNEELKEGEKLAAEVVEKAATAAARKEFQHVLDALKGIDAAHGSFDAHAEEVIELLSNGEVEKVIEKEQAVEAEVEKLDHELEALLSEIGKFTAKSARTAESHEKFAITLLIGISIAAILLASAASWFLVRRALTRPLGEVVTALDALIAGNTDVQVTVYADDEIGAVAKALDTFRQKVIENNEAGEIKKQIAEAARLLRMIETMPVNVMLLNPTDFTITYVNQTSKTTLGPLQSHLPCPVDNLVGQCVDIFHKNPAHQRAILKDPKNLPHRAQIKLGDESLDLRVSAVNDQDGHYVGAMLVWSVVTEQVRMADNFETNIKGVVDAVSSSATEMQSTAESMGSTAEETNNQASAVAAASEELTASVNEIAQQMSRSATIAASAVEEAERSNAMVQGLAEAADKIGEVVNLINDIASQTNLLALNATIEAARAGDAGKGFAVVAAEVKNLANQTAKATEDIGAQVTSIQGATQDAVSAIQGIGKTISEISEIATTISSAVEEQTAATQEVTGNITGVTTASGETGQAANQVLEASNDLSKQGAQLTTQIDAFLAQDA